MLKPSGINVVVVYIIWGSALYNPRVRTACNLGDLTWSFIMSFAPQSLIGRLDKREIRMNQQSPSMLSPEFPF
jgi:hypothetical protein